MKFLALVKKELRECLPCILLAFIVFLFFGIMILRVQIHHYSEYYRWYRVAGREAGSVIDGFTFIRQNPLSELGLLLLCCSIGLGLLLGAMQYWLGFFRRSL